MNITNEIVKTCRQIIELEHDIACCDNSIELDKLTRELSELEQKQ